LEARASKLPECPWIGHLLAGALALGAALAVALWWHADSIEQARYDHQVAARQCYKSYDVAPPGPDFIAMAEANVDVCYDARLGDYFRAIARVTWLGAGGVGMLAGGAVWAALWIAWRRWRARVGNWAARLIH